MCSLEYLIDRDGQQRDTSYTTVAAQSGNVLLLQNRAYLGLGFVADPALGSFVAALTAEKPLAQSEIDELRRYLDEMSGKAGE